MEEADIGELLKEKLDELPEPFIFLVVTAAEEYQTVNFELLRYMVNEKKTPGVYITVNKPYAVMKKRLEGVADARMVTFIDAVTRASGGKPEEEDGVLYIDSPKNLTDISIAISEAVQSIPQGKKFILFDTLSTLLLYNSAGTVARFVHFLIGRMRSWGAEGALLSLEKETGENVISQISQFCDATIYIGKE